MWLVYGAWSWLIVSSLVIFNTRGDVAAANHALPGAVLVLLIHGGVWLYKRNKRSTPIQNHAAEPATPLIDNSIYDQIADEMSRGYINGGLMTRATAEADGDKGRAQSIYIRLRATAIATEREDELDDLNADNTDHGVQSQADLEKELKARHFKAEMIARHQKKRDDGALAKAPIGMLMAVIVGVGTYTMLSADSSASKTVNQPAQLQHEYAELAKAHPDFEKIANDPAFHEWIKTQPVGIQRLYESTSAQDNIVLLHMYKRSRLH